MLFEYLLHDRLSELLAAHQCDLIVDVGSHVGRFAGKVRRFGFQGPIQLVHGNNRRLCEPGGFIG